MDETKMTAAEMLAQVNTAITTVLCGGQSYKIGQPVPDPCGPGHVEVHAGRPGGTAGQ